MWLDDQIHLLFIGKHCSISAQELRADIFTTKWLLHSSVIILAVKLQKHKGCSVIITLKVGGWIKKGSGPVANFPGHHQSFEI